MSKRILEEVHPENQFWLADGKAIKNLHELRNALQQMDDAVFGHHVNEERHDFHNWVKDVHQDEKLAEAMLQQKNRKGVLYEVVRRIKEVEGFIENSKIEHEKPFKKESKRKLVKKARVKKVISVPIEKKVKKSKTKKQSKEVKQINEALKQEPEKLFTFDFLTKFSINNKIETIAVMTAITFTLIILASNSTGYGLTGAVIGTTRTFSISGIIAATGVITLLFMTLYFMQEEKW